MVCKACGRTTTNENANFCEYCGYSFRENIQLAQENNNGIREQKSIVHSDDSEKPISFGNWMGTMLLPVIPILGIFIYFVMLFVWAFGSETPKSKKNWARATLVVLLVSIIILVVIMTSTLSDFVNSGLTMEQYMNQMQKAYY